MSPHRPSFHKAHPSAGSRPGTLVIPPGSPPPSLFVLTYDHDSIDEQPVSTPGDLPDQFSESAVTWVDVRGYGDEAVVRELGQRFEMTPLALEDAINAPQRPKSEIYPAHHLVISRLPIFDQSGELSMPQVCVLIGPHYLVTFQERPLGLFEPVRDRIRQGAGRPIRRLGPDYLAYALIDTMVDRYYPVAEGLAHTLDAIEGDLLDESEEVTLDRLRRVRRQLVMLRRIAAPQREMVEALSNEVLSMVGHRTNEIMKVLTLMASVFIPLTFIAGIYGMNFAYMPELQERYGYFMALAVMLVVAIAMVVYFRRRGRLGRRRRAAHRSPSV